MIPQYRYRGAEAIYSPFRVAHARLSGKWRKAVAHRRRQVTGAQHARLDARIVK